MAAKSTKTKVTFNHQAFIIPHSAVASIPPRFNGQVVNIDNYLIGVPDELEYEGHVEVEGLTRTEVYANAYIRLYTTTESQHGVGWLDNKTVVIADGELLLYVNIMLPRPKVWWVIDSGVKHVDQNVGKRTRHTAVDLTDYLVVDNYVIRPTHIARLDTDDECEYEVKSHCTILPEWTLNEVVTTDRVTGNEFLNKRGEYRLLFTDSGKQYLLSQLTSDALDYEQNQLRFWTERSEGEVARNLREAFPSLDFMLVLVDRDRRQGNYLVLGMRCNELMCDNVRHYINSISE